MCGCIAGRFELAQGASADDKLEAQQVYKQLAIILEERHDDVLYDPKTLVVRDLPPGRVSDLFLVYSAACAEGNTVPASQRTFLRVWRNGWKGVLRFRKASTHSLCKVCHLLKHKIREAETLTDQAIASAKLIMHQRSQWADRMVYWATRHRAKTQRDTISLIIDAMDKSKFAVPRHIDGVRMEPQHMLFTYKLV